MVPTGLKFDEVCSLPVMWHHFAVSSGGQMLYHHMIKMMNVPVSSLPPLFYKLYSHTRGQNPHDLITPYKSHFLKQSGHGFSSNINFGGIKSCLYFHHILIHSTLKTMFYGEVLKIQLHQLQIFILCKVFHCRFSLKFFSQSPGLLKLRFGKIL